MRFLLRYRTVLLYKLSGRAGRGPAARTRLVITKLKSR